MKPGGGHAKGSQFERETCEWLSRWLDPTTDITHMWRSSQSGGRMTVRRQKGKDSDSTGAGDLSPLTVLGHKFLGEFTVECKHVKTLNITSGILTGKQELSLFWGQACRDAAHAGKRPILIAKQNRFPVLALLRTSDYSSFFGAVSDYEIARLFKLGRPTAPSVSMFYLAQLLRSPYVEARFIK